MNKQEFEEMYTPYMNVPSDGVVLALMSCRICGATIMFSAVDTITAFDVHIKWHNQKPQQTNLKTEATPL